MYHVGLRVLAAIIALCASVTLCRADAGADAQAAFERKDYATAIRLWQPLAEEGDAQAQLGLGMIYLRGLGVPQDADKGLTWLELVAEGGDPRGAMFLGLAYDTGVGVVPRDAVKAYKWLDIAVSLSHTKVAIETSKLFLGSVARESTDEQLASATKLAEQWRAAHPHLVPPD